MVENFGSVLYLVLFLVQLVGFSFYSFLILFNPKKLTADYGFGESAVPLVRLVGSFVIPIVLIGIYLLFTSIEGAWVYFILVLLLDYKDKKVPQEEFKDWKIL